MIFGKKKVDYIKLLKQHLKIMNKMKYKSVVLEVPHLNP